MTTNPHTSTTQQPPDHSRAGAIWVTGTGAFLMLVAAAVFVAVQWDNLGDAIKLAILGALTGSFLLAGRRLKSILPATAGVLYHLGAFLIPINVAAAGLRFNLSWQQHILVGGCAATTSWFVLNRVEHSVVLRWATASAVVATAIGIGATTDVPAPVALALFALVGEVLQSHRVATAWALIAGLAPSIALVGKQPTALFNVLEDLGLAGTTPVRTAFISGAICAVILARQAHRTQDLVLVVTAALSIGLGFSTGWTSLHPEPEHHLLGGATLFVLIEVVAHLVHRDSFWGRPGHILGVIGEWAAVVLTPIAFVAALWHLPPSGDTKAAWPALVAGVLAAVAWFIADLRRRDRGRVGPTAKSGSTGIALLVGSGWGPCTFGIVTALLAGVAAGTGDLRAVAAAMVVISAVLVVSGRPFGHAFAVILSTPAPLLVMESASDNRIFVAVIGATGATVLACAAVVRARMSDRALNAPFAWALAGATLGPIGAAHVALWRSVDTTVLLAGTVLVWWIIAAILDLGGSVRGANETNDIDTNHLGLVGRLFALTVLAESASLGSDGVALVAGLMAMVAATDAARRRSPIDLVTFPITLPVLVATICLANGMSIANAGIAVCVLAAVAAGVQLLLPDEWGLPALAVVATSATAGFLLTSGHFGTAGTAAIIVGGIGLAYATVYRSIEGTVASWIVVTFGIWGLLIDAQVGASDAYIAPVAAALLVAGLRSRRVGVSSWVAYGPPVLLLGGASLLERMHGGGGWHAIVAGSIGVSAVVAGGGKRLIGPLLLGTALLLGLTGHESLVVTRGIPTWGWLALGGSVLLAAGISMERLDTGPLESGRRLVDTIGTRFN